jgi:hypothetical protein
MHRRGEMGVSWASELESRTRLEVRFETRSHVLELGGEAGTRSDGETNRERDSSYLGAFTRSLRRHCRLTSILSLDAPLRMIVRYRHMLATSIDSIP